MYLPKPGSVRIECSLFTVQYGGPSHVWLLSMGNTAGTTEELNFFIGYSLGQHSPKATHLCPVGTSGNLVSQGSRRSSWASHHPTG